MYEGQNFDGTEESVQLENMSTPSQPVYLVNRTQVSSPPIWCPVQICNTQVNMELDTGAGVTLIDEDTYNDTNVFKIVLSCSAVRSS